MMSATSVMHFSRWQTIKYRLKYLLKVIQFGSTTMVYRTLPLLKSGSLSSLEIDGIIYVSEDATGSSAPLEIQPVLKKIHSLDESFAANVSILAVDLPAKRLVFSPVGKITDYDDVRSYTDAAAKGIKRAISAGIKTPLILLPVKSAFASNVDVVTLLGALEALYVPIQLREEVPSRKQKVTALYVATESGSDVSQLLELAETLEQGRVIARDIGGGDPERMAAPRVQEYVEEAFKGSSNISVEVIDEDGALEREYPLFAAVNRAAKVIERHRGRVIYLRYKPKGDVKKTLYLVGKGITYDTGGADIKTEGKMVGMSRDKCGAAAVAGFLKVVSLIEPKGLSVVGALCLARNSVGENAYVADEVLTARSGARVRVGNTDAEGRMAMADVLCKLKEEALLVDSAHLVTIATLTGHAVLSVGPYSIAIDNSVARQELLANSIQKAGGVLGDPFEVSTLRREDFIKHRGVNEGDDCHQCGAQSSARTQRGHQGPAAFLIMASGLDKHGLASDKPLKYTHIDIAGSAGDFPHEPSGAPIIAMYGTYLRGF